MITERPHTLVWEANFYITFHHGETADAELSVAESTVLKLLYLVTNYHNHRFEPRCAM